MYQHLLIYRIPQELVKPGRAISISSVENAADMIAVVDMEGKRLFQQSFLIKRGWDIRQRNCRASSSIRADSP